MISLLVYVLILVLIIGLVIYAVQQLPLPPPWKNFAIIIVVIIAILILLGLLGLIPMGRPVLPP